MLSWSPLRGAPKVIQDLLYLLLAAVVVVPLFQRLGLGSILGYLTAGVLVGPVLGLVTGSLEIARLAELGVVLLLFLIGLELRPERLWAMRGVVLGLGGAQLLLTGLVLAALALALGLAPGAATLVGFTLALSSTAFVLQLLTERNALGHPEGKAALGVLLLQDLAVAPLLAAVAVLAHPSSEPWGRAAWLGALEGVGALALVILAGRFAVRPLLVHIAAAGKRELFAVTVLLLAVGTGWLLERTGLSMAMGAFLAGVLLSGSEFRHQILADVEHFRDLFLGLFFMTVGMGVDPGFLWRAPWTVLGLALGLILVKAAVLYPVCLVYARSRAQAAALACYLAQAGEFAFVLLAEARSTQLLPAAVHDTLVMVVMLSLAATPPLFALGQRVARKAAAAELAGAPVGAPPAEGAVLIAGFGRFGRRLAAVLEAVGLRYVAVDQHPGTVLEARRRGHAVYYGDAARHGLLEHLGARRAALAVVAVDQPPAARRLVQSLRRLAPGLPVVARARTVEDGQVLLALGAGAAVPEDLESSLQLAALVLRRLGLDEGSVQEALERQRQAEQARAAAAGGE